MMDYNYVRMRKAQRLGDEALAAYYRNLCEKGKPVRRDYTIYNAVIIILAVIVLMMGIFIIYSETKEDIAFNNERGDICEVVHSIGKG